MTAIVKRRKPLDQLRRLSSHPVGECARCHENVPLAARRLCDACWYMARKDGTLADYPRSSRRPHYSDDELIEEYDLLASAGNTHEVIAARLGYANPRHLRNRVAAIRDRSAR